MMKKTLCLFSVLALIAQICAMPADHVDAEKDAAGAADHGTGLKDEAAKVASDATDKATKVANDAKEKATKGATDDANKVTGAADDAKNKGEHGVTKHGGKDCHKPGHGPIIGGIEVGKKIVDDTFKGLKDLMQMLRI